MRRRLAHSIIGLVILGSMAAAVPPAGADPNNDNSDKLRQAVTLDGVRRHQRALQDIADANGGNRFAGLPGFDRSADYVESQLRAAGYQVTRQEFSYFAFFEETSSQLEQTAPAPTVYVNGNDFRIMQYSGSGTAAARVTPIDVGGSDSGCQTSDFTGFPAGDIALVKRGTCPFRLKTTNAALAGASAVLIFNNIPGLLNGTLGATDGLATIPSLGLTQALGEQLVAAATAGLRMRVFTDTDARNLPTRNLFAETAEGDPDNVVVVGAHLDSVNAGPGINDNGSGSAAILETAVQMSKVKPRNKVRFAWWGAEESGLVGSRLYVGNLPTSELEKIVLYLNFDMVGSPNFVRFVYDGDNSAGGGSVGPAGSEVVEQLLVGYFSSVGLATEPTPFNGRSDYGPFIEAGIPAGGLFTGAEGIKTAAQAATYGGTAGAAYDPCYHAACDTYANNSDTALDQMADAIAHATITYAQSTEAINGVKGKGNFKRFPIGVNGTGAGGGGGLHDDHELDAA